MSRSIYLFLASLCIFFGVSATKVVVIIPSYNNAAYCCANLDSVLMQDFQDFSVIYIDDCSTDSTAQEVAHYIAAHNAHDKIKLIRNEYNRKAMVNIYLAVHQLGDDVLVVVLDGDDAFAHPRVLSTIEKIHREQHVWVSYAQYMNVPEHKAREWGLSVHGYAGPVPESVITNNSFRRQPWCWSGLRSFYAWIFKKIRLEDLLYCGSHASKCVPSACDNAYFFPLLEMSGTHTRFIDEILLHRNVDTPFNDFKVNRNLQHEIALFIRNKPSYQPLSSAQPSPAQFTQKIPLLVFANDEHHLKNCLASCGKISGISEIHIFTDTALNFDSSHYPTEIFVHRTDTLPEILATSAYVMLCSDKHIFTQPICIKDSIAMMRQTYTTRYYVDADLGNIPLHMYAHAPCERLETDCIAFRLETCAQFFHAPFESTDHAYITESAEILNLIKNCTPANYKTKIMHAKDAQKVVLSCAYPKIT